MSLLFSSLKIAINFYAARGYSLSGPELDNEASLSAAGKPHISIRPLPEGSRYHNGVKPSFIAVEV